MVKVDVGETTGGEVVGDREELALILDVTETLAETLEAGEPLLEGEAKEELLLEGLFAEDIVRSLAFELSFLL